MKHIIERALFCRCEKCEEAVADILRMEQMLCHGGKRQLTMRRKEIQTGKRKAYFRQRYAEKVGDFHNSTVTTCSP